MIKEIALKATDGALSVGSEEIEDLAQTACARMWSALQSGKPITNPRGYVYKSIKHLVGRKAKQARRERRLLENLAARTDSSRSARALERLEKVWSALDRLPDGDSDIIKSRFFKGLSSKSIGNESGLSSAAVRQRLSRALGVLRTALRNSERD